MIMLNIARIKYPNLFNLLNTVPKSNSEHVFDPGSYGQYLGGVDKEFFSKKLINNDHYVGRNIIKYGYKIKMVEGLPVVTLDGKDFELVNLHIHKKSWEVHIKMKVIISKIFAKITTKFYIYYQKHLKKYFKLSSTPYVSGDTFRAQSNHVLDDTSKIDPKKVKTGDILFVKTDYLDEFIHNCLPVLPDSLKLITHNSDINIEKNLSEKN